MNERQKNFGVIAAIAAGAGALWYLGNRVTKVAEKTADTIAKPIADAVLAVTLPGQVKLVGRVVFPNGGSIPLDNIRVNDALRFVYAGRKYEITGRTGSDYFTREITP